MLSFPIKAGSYKPLKEQNFDPKKIEKKLKLASDLFEIAFEMKRFQIKQKYPHLTDQEYLEKWIEQLRLTPEWKQV